jgi:hypothetical protein
MSKAKKVYDLAVKTGTYEVGPGQTKGRWMNVGAVMEMPDGGRFVMLDRTFNPAGVPDLNGKGGDSVLLTMFDPSQQGQQGVQAQNQPYSQQAPAQPYAQHAPHHAGAGAPAHHQQQPQPAPHPHGYQYNQGFGNQG